MKKLLKFAGMIGLLMLLFFIGSLFADKQTLRNEVIRLHVVADSDSREDQAIKLSVRDAILSCIEPDMGKFDSTQQAKNYLSSHLVVLEDAANQVLKELGSADKANVYLTKEAFGKREYDTFSLPSGIYDSLRVEIGSAKGRNWWCVVFPALCVPATQEAFADTAVAAGFDPELTGTLSGSEEYAVRFFLLDCLGKIENLFSFS